MPYGTIKVDNITFTNAGVDQTVTVSGIVQSISGNITATGTIQGATIIGTSTVSGATVTGNAGLFVTATAATGVFTSQVSGATVLGTAGSFTTLTGGTVTITSGVFSSGTAAAPSISIGTTTNGLYSPGTNQVAISTAGSGRLFVDASGNVGVGAAPSTRLETYVASGGNTLRLTNASNTGSDTCSLQFVQGGAQRAVLYTSSNILYLAGDATTVLSAGSTSPLVFNAGGSERLRITSAGLVGIATSSPSDTLHVNGTSQITGLARFNNGIQLKAATQNYIYFDDALSLTRSGVGDRLTIDSSGRVGIGTASPSTLLHLASSAAGTALQIANSSDVSELQQSGNSFFISNYTASGPLVFRAGSAAERARITSDGKLGLGTSSPAQLLHLSQSGTGDFTSIRFANTGASGRSYDFGLGGNTTGLPGAFYLYDNNAAATRLLINSSGNVGIGTTSPGAALDVRGGSRFYADSNGLSVDNIGRSADNISIIRFLNNAVSTELGRVAHYGNDLDVRNLTANSLTFGTSNTERARIDSSGRLLVGTSTAIGNGDSSPNARLQVHTPNYYGADLAQYSADAFGSTLYLEKSRGSSVGSHAVVSNNDQLAAIRFAGSDGSAFKHAAFIEAYVDGTPGTNDMPGRLVFSTTADGASSPTERMRITQDGSVLLNTGGNTIEVTTGTTTGAYYNNSGKQLVLARDGGAPLVVQRRSSDGTIQGFYRDGTLVGTISVTTTATAYNTSSDYRLKENVTPVTDGITRLQQLKPSRFNFIADPTKTVDGFLAHEAAEVVPECVTGEKDAVDDEGNPQYQGIDQSKLVPLLTAALQEAIGEIESLKARVAALESA